MKTRDWFGFSLVLCLFMAGCAALDSALGVNPDGSRSSGFLDSVIAPLANGFIPFSGTAATALAGIYAAWRGRKWRKVAESTFDAVEAGAQAVESVKDLKKRLAGAHIEAGVKGYVTKIVNRYGHSAAK